MATITHAQTYANNEVAYLAWAVDQDTIPGCLEFNIFREYLDPPGLVTEERQSTGPLYNGGAAWDNGVSLMIDADKGHDTYASNSQPVRVEPTLLVGGSSSMREGKISTRLNPASDIPRKKVWQDSSISQAMTPIHYRLLHRCRQTADSVMKNSLSIRKVECLSIAKRTEIQKPACCCTPLLRYGYRDSFTSSLDLCRT